MTPLAALLLLTLPTDPAVLIDDAFERAEQDDSKEQVGGGWGTNSKSRAQGMKQVDLDDGALHITRHEVADHGVSVVHEAAFKDATITLRFKLPPKGDLGLNIADMNEKSVHAGHICMLQITPTKVQIRDLKTGNMRLDLRTKRKAGEKLTAAEQELIASRGHAVKRKTKPGVWHDLTLTIAGETMTATIDGEQAATFTSPGIGHETKSRLRVAVNNEAWIDDVKLVRE